MSLTVILLIAVSALFHALWNFAAKKASGNFYAVYLGLVMSCIVFFPALFLIPASEMLKTRAYPYILASGAVNAVYFFALARSYEHGEISMVYPIARGIGIAGTALLAYLLLGERASPLGIAGILAISAGIVLTGCQHLRPGILHKGLMYALLVGSTTVSYSIIDKLGVGIMNPVAYAFGFTLVATLLLTPYVVLYKRRQLTDAWKNYRVHGFIVGVGSLATYLLILFIFRIAKVSYVVALRELAVAFGALLGFRFLGEKPTPVKIAGIALIVLGVIVIKMAR